MGKLRSLTLSSIIAVGGIAVNHEIEAQPSGGATPPLTANASRSCPPGRPGLHESYHLPPPTKLPDGISFATDWTQNHTGGWGGEQVMDRCRIQPDGSLTWHGRPAVRVEVQPNDDPLALNSNSERAEMLIMQSVNKTAIKENSKSGTQYYATSYYFPTTWRGQQLPWSAFAPADCTARGQNQCNSWSFVWQFYGWGALGAAQTAVNGPQHYIFNNALFTDGGLIAMGKWTDFIFMVDWRTGDYAVWRRDEGQVTFARSLTGRTAVPPGREIYVKQGLYRGGDVGDRIDVLWMGPTARGLSFSAVEDHAFGTNNGQSENKVRP